MTSLVASYRGCWRPLVLADLAFKLLAYVLLTPIVGLVFRGFLWWSGRSILADVEIARFLIHPSGWVAFTVVVGGMVGILALELAAAMTLALAFRRQQPTGALAALWFTATHARGVLRLAGKVAARLLMLAVPFLAVGGACYWLLLTRHDINYYLAERPAEFYVAGVLIGGALAGLILTVGSRLIAWSLALPLVLFEGLPPGRALAISGARTTGHRPTIALALALWFAVTWAASACLTWLIVSLLRFSIPQASGSIWLLALAMGLGLLAWSIVQLAESVLASTSLGVLLAELYQRAEPAAAPRLPQGRLLATGRLLRLTRGRLLSGVCLALLAATLMGAAALQGFRLDDRVEITAHRGGAVHAPENTLAAIRRAIEAGTDWVEIDVQETSDGVVVVAHDSDLRRAAGESRKIWELSAQDLESIDIGSSFDPKFYQERVPTLAQVLELCRGKAKVNIELKYYGHDQSLEQRVVELVEAHDMASQIVVMSLEAAGIQKLKKLRPEWTTGLLVAVAAGDVSRAEADFLAISSKLATPERIARIHARGKPVHVWTLNDAALMSAMISRGADNLITDDPALARAVLAERASMSPLERVLVELAVMLEVAVPAPVDLGRP